MGPRGYILQPPPAAVDNLSGVITMDRSSGAMTIAGVADKEPERLARVIINAGRD